VVGGGYARERRSRICKSEGEESVVGQWVVGGNGATRSRSSRGAEKHHVSMRPSMASKYPPTSMARTLPILVAQHFAIWRNEARMQNGGLQGTAWPEHATGPTQRLSLIRHVHNRHKGGYKIERPVGKLKCLEEENRRLKQLEADLSPIRTSSYIQLNISALIKHRDEV
jgi:hypothetical protein